MTDYIKRKAALKIINDMTENEDDYCRCTNMINELPSDDVVEVVRCKDCKRENTDSCPFFTSILSNSWSDDFCSLGERTDK